MELIKSNDLYDVPQFKRTLSVNHPNIDLQLLLNIILNMSLPLSILFNQFNSTKPKVICLLIMPNVHSGHFIRYTCPVQCNPLMSSVTMPIIFVVPVLVTC